MPLVSSKEMLCRARQGGYAVGSFNIFNLESAQAIVQAAEAERAPVMLQVWSGFEAFIGLDVLGAIAVSLARRASVPVAVHLDHGATLAQVGTCLASGYTSIMLDGSALPLAENIAVTKQVVEVCSALHIPVEGEIGHVGGAENGSGRDAIVYTDPDEAVTFWKESGVDFVAVSIGTFHGTYEDTPKLNIPLLQDLAQRIDAPLVLHGSSYTPDDQLADAVRHGISKVNVATELSNEVIRTTLEHVSSLGEVRYANELSDVPYRAMSQLVAQKIRLFGGSGKADC